MTKGFQLEDLRLFLSFWCGEMAHSQSPIQQSGRGERQDTLVHGRPPHWYNRYHPRGKCFRRLVVYINRLSHLRVCQNSSLGSIGVSQGKGHRGIVSIASSNHHITGDFFKHPKHNILVHTEKRSVLLAAHSHWTPQDAEKLLRAVKYFGRYARTISVRNGRVESIMRTFSAGCFCPGTDRCCSEYKRHNALVPIPNSLRQLRFYSSYYGGNAHRSLVSP